MRSLISWKDHVVEKPGVFAESDAGNGNVKLDPRFGEVIQQGTPQNATNFNIMDLAAFEAMLMANENARQIRFLMDSMGAVEGLKIPVTLKNTYDYPSTTRIQLCRSRRLATLRITRWRSNWYPRQEAAMASSWSQTSWSTVLSWPTLVRPRAYLSMST